MRNLDHITTTDPLRVLGDERRLAILRLLMAKPMTLSQLGRTLDAYPAKVRHHLIQLEEAGLVEMTATKVIRGFVEKYYQATAQAYLVNLAIVPASADAHSILAFGSHDLALEMLAQQLHQIKPNLELFSLPVGSLDGLIALRQGICQLAGCHLLDEVSGEYNRDYVRHLFPGQEMKLFTLTNRQQGLLVRAGNPRHIQNLADLTREDVRFVNRQPGSGTRLWLDSRLRDLGIAQDQITGYANELHTHLQVGHAVAEGKADAGLGLLAATRRYGLDFIPLFEERYDLVMKADTAAEPMLQPLLDQLHSGVLRRSIDDLGGYDTAGIGNVMVVKG